MTADVVLAGCRDEPLGAYLKAMGVFRVVAEQLDGGALARWQAGRLVLTTGHSLEDLVAFLADDYRPTPIVSPWNGGSGFGAKDNTAGIEAVEGSAVDRLALYRRTIAAARRLVEDPCWPAMGKDEQVQWCRNELPDEAVRWLDAAVVLTDAKPAFPPLLGTGGNVGRLEFSNNLMQRLADAFCLTKGRNAPTRAVSAGWLAASVTAEASPPLRKGAVGQFDPGAAGGTNAPGGGPEDSLVNPWDFVLAFEGALLFASGAARRMGAGSAGKAAMPFTFDVTPVGYASAADGEAAKGELWAPLWERPASLAEVARLLGEGRVEWGGGQARRGIDVARAATSLGVDRGISGFVRHSFVERMGQAMLAVPTGRVTADDRLDVPVLAELDTWLDQVRNAPNLPAAPGAAMRRLEAAMFEVTRARGPRPWQEVLAAAAALERLVARSGKLRGDRVRAPLGAHWRAWDGHRPFDATRWVPLVQEDTPEFRLALALASARDRRPPKTTGGVGSADPAALLRPVEPVVTAGGEGGRQGSRLDWRTGGRPLVDGLGLLAGRDVDIDLTSALGGFVARRAVVATSRRGVDVEAGRAHLHLAYWAAEPALLEDVAAFLDRRVDDQALARLLSGLLLLRFDRWSRTKRGPGGATSPAPNGMPAGTGGDVSEDGESGGRSGERHGAAGSGGAGAEARSSREADLDATTRGPTGAVDDDDTVLPEAAALPPLPAFPAAAALALPFFGGRADPPLYPGPAWPRLLARGTEGIREVVRDARRRLRNERMTPLVGDGPAVSHGVDGPRLLAAAAFPLSAWAANHLLRQVAAPSTRLDPIPSAGAESTDATDTHNSDRHDQARLQEAR